ncbi:spermatogenesis- and oogenesis-specific basic helix-loop-helix-containing protein 1 [Eptesicus fuscus]|uniref:spermatogenesis- and oogenesis-specific basic helix-loop-helix-containing protein 1 n=1 Tax=Eptesicus fuscus TaxID=29078 RepID=UPI002403FD57|nr:spermatogenesis- and oogenesis-specific basic helix-loop-helix-containing protein 1 [Eptesicus fuscus]
MASRGPQPSAEVPRVPIPRACCTSSGPPAAFSGFAVAFWGFGNLELFPLRSSSSSPGARFPLKDPGGGACPAQTPAEVGRPACCLPRNVLSERERRKRISLSCEHLRALLPRFDGRREDMASVLEMSVQFLRMAGTLLPSGEQQAVLGPTEEDWHKWQLSQTPAEAPGAGTGAPGTVPQDAPSGVTTGVDQGKAPTGVAEALDRPAVLPGSLGRGAVLVAQLGVGGAGGSRSQWLLRWSVPTCGVEDGPSLLLSASPKWWLGSPEGRDSSAPSGAPAGSPLDRTEPGFLADPEPSAQETPDGPLEPWGWDVGCPSLAFRDEVDSIFPDFFAS